MKFSFKVFAAIFAVSILVLAVSGVGILGLMRRQAETDYVRQYRNYSQQIGDTLHQIDVVTELLMRNAAYVLREREREGGLPSTAQLKRLRDELHMFNLYVTDNRGKFIRSTFSWPIEQERPLFTYCEDYRGLINGKADIERTPILRAPDLSWPFKFLMIPNHDRTRVLEVSVAMEFVSDTLNNAMKPDKDILSIGLYTPNGNVLGYVHASGEKAPLRRFDASMVSFTAPEVSKSGYVFFTRVPTTVGDCCECRTKGLTMPDGKYFYVLRTEVSRANLDARLARLGRWFFAVGVLALLLSGLMAYLISRHLVQQLVWMGERVKQIALSGRWDTRLRLRGRDEVGLLAEKFDDMLERLHAGQTELAEAEKQKALVELAKQVAHDIRSPLAALDSVVGRSAKVPEEDRVLIRSAVNRIKDIANDLLEKNRRGKAGTGSADGGRVPDESPSVQLLSSLVEPLITEKRMQFRSKIGVGIHSQIDAQSYGLFALVPPADFKRVVSNLVNNAVEALGQKGTVLVRLSADDRRVRLEIRDTGKGIPAEVLATLGRRDESFGKAGGSGLGLSHARAAAEAWGGALELQSEVGKGTTATLVLPMVDPPPWFVSVLEVAAGGTIVIVDDDTSVHQVWQRRFEALGEAGKGLAIRHFSTPAELREWAAGSADQARTAIYLLDYELLGHAETGLSLVSELGLGSQAILVTSRFEERPILDECLQLGARMIPKGLAGFVPIRVVEAGKPDAVLVDDDPMVRKLWLSSAKRAEKALKAYTDPATLLAELESGAIILSRDSAIYIDSKLADGIKGEDVAKTLHLRGFVNVRLATGHAPEHFPPMAHVREVVGKEPPWG